MAVQPRMPNAVQLEQSLGAGGALRTARSGAAELRDEERRGRLTRAAQIQDQCTVQATVTAEFSGGAASALIPQWISFGTIHFVEEPAGPFTGTKRMVQKGEPPLAADLSNFSLVTHETAPCLAVAVDYRQVAGHYVAAKVVIYAVGPVSDGFKAKVSLLFVGPAVRMG